MQKLYFYIDDSGVLGSPTDKYFVYAGFVFESLEEAAIARRHYRKVCDGIKKSLEIPREDELKGSNLLIKHKRSLFNSVKAFESMYVVVENARLDEFIRKNKQSRHRFKDYVLKRIIKEKIRQLIRAKKIDPNKPLKIILNIDEQLTASDGYYDLRSSVYEELVNGVSNFNYSVKFQPILFSDLDLVVHFKDSKADYLIQASDIWANRVLTSMYRNKPNLRSKGKNERLYLP